MSHDWKYYRNMRFTFRDKLPYYIRIVYGLIAGFIIVGIIAGRGQQAIVFAAILVMAYTMNRIIQEASEAFTMLGKMKKHDLEGDDSGPGDKKDPPVGPGPGGTYPPK